MYRMVIFTLTLDIKIRKIASKCFMLVIPPQSYKFLCGPNQRITYTHAADFFLG